MIGNGRKGKDGARALNTGRGVRCTGLEVWATLEDGDVQRLGSRAGPWATPTLPGAWECHCPWPRPRSPRHFPRLGFPWSAGVWEHCTTVARLQSPPCRAASSAHQSSGQISILSRQARYPRPAACCATKKEGLALQDASAESLCQNEPRRARVRAENWLLRVSVQRH